VGTVVLAALTMACQPRVSTLQDVQPGAAAADTASVHGRDPVWVSNGVSGVALGIAVNPSTRTVYTLANSSSPDRPALVTALRPWTGTALWQARGGPADFSPLELSLTPDGRELFVVGSAYEDTSRARFLVLAFDARSGKPLWKSHYDPSGPHTDMTGAQDASVSAQGGRLYVTGQASLGESRPSVYLTVAFGTRSGRVLWARGLFKGEDTLPMAIASDPAHDRVYITGGGDGGRCGCRFVGLTVAYNGSSGTEIWRRISLAPDGWDDQPFGIATSPDGTHVAVIGKAGTIPPADNETEKQWLHVEALDGRTGKRLWSTPMPYKRFRLSNGASGVVTASGRRLIVAAAMQSPRSHTEESLVVSYAMRRGKVVWASKFDLPHRDDGVGYISLGPSGRRVYVDGDARTAFWGPSDVLTIAYSVRTGRQIWRTRYNSSANGMRINESMGLAVDPDGHQIYVCGDDEGQEIDDATNILTLAYDP
jgi:outer membrane protein assembly factor BamB